jgi:Uma2 family endonuclease
MAPSVTPKIPVNVEPNQSEWEPMPIPDLREIVTEDDTPVDNLISEKQQRLLTVSLYSSLERDVPFLATANVGLFYGANKPPLVPDILLSFGVSSSPDLSQKQNRSYFVWNFGKPPEVAIEIVSNKVGNELGSKLTDYAHAGVAYYVVFDPLECLGDKILSVYELRATQYHLLDDYWLDDIQLGLTLWQGEFERCEYSWLRWCDRQGNILLTGDEKAEREKQRAEKLAEILRSQGIDPDRI